MPKNYQIFNNQNVGNIAGNIEGNFVVSASNPRNLARAAAEIQDLLNELSQAYPTATAIEQMVVATKALEEIEQNPTLKQHLITALKSGGEEALKKMIENPSINILLAAVEGWKAE